jgi:hypothetical protein
MAASRKGQKRSLTHRLHLPPSWTLLLAALAAGAVTAWRLVSGTSPLTGATHLAALLSPGLIAFIAVYLFAWLGWALDID